MKDLVEYIAKALVDDPDSVQVTEDVTDKSSVITLRVDRTDLGKVIGKKGRTAKAMRTLIGASASKLGRRASLEIMEPEQPEVEAEAAEAAEDAAEVEIASGTSASESTTSESANADADELPA